jgi:hypothetical protein
VLLRDEGLAMLAKVILAGAWIFILVVLLVFL